MKLINNEKQLMHQVNKDSKLFTYLKDELILSYRQTNSLIKNKNLFINHQIVQKNQIIHEKDIITIYFKDEQNEYEPEEIDLDIIYQTDDLLIINKKPNMVVHPTQNVTNHTYANAVSNYFNTIGLKRKIRFVNRLDRDTSGLLIIAKNSYSHGFLTKQFEKEEIKKTYLALATGHFQEKQGVITSKIQKVKEKYQNDTTGKKSETHYCVIKEYKDYSLVKCMIKSGRTHQIRVHLELLGHFILGDSLYYQPSELINRQALHAYKLSFIEPRTFQLVSLMCQIPLDMKNLIT